MREHFRIKSNSRPNSIAGAIASSLRQGNIVELQAVGAGAVNQAVKSIIIADGFLSPSGLHCCSTPSFAEVDLSGEVKTAIRYTIVGKYA